MVQSDGGTFEFLTEVEAPSRTKLETQTIATANQVTSIGLNYIYIKQINSIIE